MSAAPLSEVAAIGAAAHLRVGGVGVQHHVGDWLKLLEVDAVAVVEARFSSAAVSDIAVGDAQTPAELSRVVELVPVDDE